MKKALLILLIICCFGCVCSSVGAVEIDFDSAEGALPDNVKKVLDGIDLENTEELLKTVGPENIFDEIGKLIKSGFKKPFRIALGVVALLLTVSVVESFKPDDKSLSFITTLGVISLAVMPTVSVIGVFTQAVKSASAFLTAFIPIFAGIIAAKGRAVTAANFSAAMLFVSQGLSYTASFAVVPMSGIQLALGIGGSFVSEINVSSISRGVNKAAMWMLSIVSAVFLGVLGLQTLISVPADTASTKAVKFVVGTAVPVVGNVVSEALGAFTGSLKLIGSSAAVYGIIALLLIMLPIIIDLLLWRLAMIICRCSAELLSLTKVGELIKSAENCFSLVLGVSVLIILIFVISLAVICAV